jgi:hypothetical protein
MNDEAHKLTKITITSGTAFDGAIVEEKEVCEVTDQNRAQARYLVSIGKAIEGEVPAADSKAKSENKSIGLNTQGADALVKK